MREQRRTSFLLSTVGVVLGRGVVLGNGVGLLLVVFGQPLELTRSALLLGWAGAGAGLG